MRLSIDLKCCFINIESLSSSSYHHKFQNPSLNALLVASGDKVERKIASFQVFTIILCRYFECIKAALESKMAPSEGKVCDSFNMLIYAFTLTIPGRSKEPALSFCYVENQEFMPEWSNT